MKPKPNAKEDKMRRAYNRAAEKLIPTEKQIMGSQEELIKWAWQKGRQEMEKEMQSKYDIYEYGAVAKLQEKARQEGKMEEGKRLFQEWDKWRCRVAILETEIEQAKRKKLICKEHGRVMDACLVHGQEYAQLTYEEGRAEALKVVEEECKKDYVENHLQIDKITWWVVALNKAKKRLGLK